MSIKVIFLRSGVILHSDQEGEPSKELENANPA